MKIEIKLKDWKYCNGCPFYELDHLQRAYNGMFYNKCLLKKEYELGYGEKIKRPKKCIKENGR